MTEERADGSIEVDETAEETRDDGSTQYGVGPFSIREVALVAVWLIAFIVSFFSIASEQAMERLLFGGSVWTNGLDWILTIGVPTVAVFLLVLRRFSPDGIRRVGSLAVDQFASVAFSVSAVVWLTLLWRNIAVAIETGVWIYGWVLWLEFFLMLAGVVLTVAAPFIPPFSEDFAGRREVTAHRNARPIRAVSPRPPRESRAAAEVDEHTDSTAVFDTGAYGAGVYGADAYGQAQAGDTAPVALSGDRSFAEPAAAGQEAWAPSQTRDTFEPVEAQRESQPAHQAFWALVPEERDVLDDRGVPMFRIGPTAWALVLEDRGEVFVVRHEDGRVGYLHDVSDVTRG